MKPIRFAQSNTIIKGNGKDVMDVHAAIVEYPNGKPAFITAWRPTPEELTKINLGEPIFLFLIGNQMQPCLITADNPFEESNENH